MRPVLGQHTQLKKELKINPRLYQAMDLLYMPLLDLQQHLKQELLNNPFLEMVEPEDEEEEEGAEAEEAPQQEEQKTSNDEIDWEDEVRLAVEARAAFSPDAMTGLEANLRFAGPETMETKIFGRLSAWQNWISLRPNASGPGGALRRYGTGQRGSYDYRRV